MSIKSQGHSLTLVKGHSDFRKKTRFSPEAVGSFETQFHMKAYGRIEIKNI